MLSRQSPSRGASLATIQPAATATRATFVAPGWWRRSAAPMGGTAAVALLFLPPALLLFTLFVAMPMGEAAWYSLYNWNGYGSPTQYTGWRNFELLLANRAFRIALTNNALIIIVSLVIQLPLALAMATLLADRIRGTATFRLIFFLPYILAEVAAGLIWRFVYDGEYGLFAKIWEMFAATAPHVLADPDVAMYAILAVVVWKYFGFHMMLYIAGLQQIDRSLYEAAHIDGATGWQIFTRITVPLLGPTIRLSIFFSILGSIQLFDLVMPLTKGGPSDSTQTMVTYLYNYGVTRTRIGFGSAVGVVLFLICVIFAFGYKKVAMRHD
jgi:raffinose/stachyose/melibiose transport system permease protein